MCGSTCMYTPHLLGLYIAICNESRKDDPADWTFKQKCKEYTQRLS